MAQLLTCMDELNLASTGGQTVIVMGATNRPDSMDPASVVRRFDREIALGIPDSTANASSACSARDATVGDLDPKALARQCNGFVGADLAALCKEAAVIAVNRIFGDLFAVNKATTPSTRPANSSRPFSAPPLMDGATEVEGGAAHGTDAAAVGPIAIEEEAGADDSEEMTAADAASAARRLQSKPLGPEQLASLAIVMSDFEAGLAKVQPSARTKASPPSPMSAGTTSARSARSGASCRWRSSSRCGRRSASKRSPSPSCGVLLHGPPGCGTTLLMAIANESGASFISVQGLASTSLSARASVPFVPCSRAAAPARRVSSLMSLTRWSQSAAASSSSLERVVSRCSLRWTASTGGGRSSSSQPRTAQI